MTMNLTSDREILWIRRKRSHDRPNLETRTRGERKSEKDAKMYTVEFRRVTKLKQLMQQSAEHEVKATTKITMNLH